MTYSVRDFVADQLKAAAPNFDWNTHDVNRAYELADILLKVGITDLSKLQLVPVKVDQQHYSWFEEEPLDALALKYDGRYYGYLGEADNVRVEPILEEDNGRFRVAWSAAGHGNVSYFLVPRPGGFAIAPTWGSSSDADDIRGTLKTVGMLALAVVLPAAGINAAVGLGQAMLGPMVGTVSPAIAGAVGQAALTTAFNGGDIEAAIKSSMTNLAASYAGAQVGGLLKDATDLEIVGKLGASATSALLTGRDVDDAVTATLIRSAPGMLDAPAAATPAPPTYKPPEGSVMTAPFSDDFGYSNTVEAPQSQFVGPPEFDFVGPPEVEPVSWGGENFGNMENISPIESNNGGFYPPDVFSDENYGNEGRNHPIQTFTPDEPAVDSWGGEGRGSLPGISPGVPAAPPITASDPFGVTFRDVVTNVTGAANAALALVRAYDASQAPNPVSRTTVQNPDGSRTVVVGLDSGVVRTTTPDGSVTNRRPPVGVAQTTASGNIIVNNGDGTYTLVKPDGTKTVVAYDPTLSADTFADKLRAVPIGVWIAGAGLLISALR